MNLDLLWSRVSGTVVGNLSAFSKIFKAAQFLGIEPNFEPLGPWHVKDDVGSICALWMIRASQLSGQHQTSHQNFDKIRKIRTLYSNIFESSSRASELMVNFRGPKGDK